MVKLIAGSLSLLAFSAAIFAGLWAGNEMLTILTRAWWAMILFLILGAVIGWMAQVVVNEHVKGEMDRLTQQLHAGNDTEASAAGVSQGIKSQPVERPTNT